MTIKTLCVADDTINYKKTVEKLLKTTLHDDFYQDKQQRSRSRRLPDHSKGKTKNNGAIPSIPGHLLELIRKGNGSQAAGLILKWKNIWNEEKRNISSDELRLNNNRDYYHSKNKKVIPMTESGKAVIIIMIRKGTRTQKNNASPL